jgi:hypothetical protein
MTTVLTEAVGRIANGIAYTFSGNTFASPRQVLQRSKAGNAARGTSAEDRLNVIIGTTDSAGNVLPGVISFEAVVRRPVNGQSADLATALATYRDIVASDEFEAMVNNQTALK